MMNLEKTNSPKPQSTQDTFSQNIQSDIPIEVQKTYTMQSMPMMNKLNNLNLTSYNHLTYALYVLSFFTGITWILAIILNYAKRQDAEGTWLYSHFDWQIKTVWYSMFFAIIAIFMMIIGFGGAFIGAMLSNNTALGGSSLLGLSGVVVMLLVFCWYLYRIVKGWIALSSQQEVS